MRTFKVTPETMGIYIRNTSDEELKEISENLGLGLTLDEMRRIRSYYEKLEREATDVELQALGQAWSEHCSYKSSKPILKQFFGELNDARVITKGDAGVVKFDDEHVYTLRIESHNHPSAIEPYGGSATGIGGIIRDILAMGSQPIALIDPLFFGPLNYPHEKIFPGLKHPKFLFSGVVAGIRDYGNRVGIPTVAGSIYFDEAYVHNCLVNVGCIGIAKRKNIVPNHVGTPEDVFILAGGRTGRDGIHGVVFASKTLTKSSEKRSRGAIQLGDPILKEPLIHACIDVVNAKLLSGLKDLGGGGLSCVIGEMLLPTGFGAEIHLDKVPLKEENLKPWEIWVSESQERMMLAVPQHNVKKVLEIFEAYDVLATPIGKVDIHDNLLKLYYKKKKVFEMDIKFFVEAPLLNREKRFSKISFKKIEKLEIKNYEKTFFSLLQDLNVCSRDYVIRQYDFEVRGRTVVKPLNGEPNIEGHSDAVLIKPVEESDKAIAIAVGIAPRIAKFDPYESGKVTVDECVRNIVSSGAVPDAITNCLNFGNPEKPEVMGTFYETVRGIAEVCSELKINVPSGNVSFYNESHSGSIVPTATVIGCGLIDDYRKVITTDLKDEGNPLYLIGTIQTALGGSLFHQKYIHEIIELPIESPTQLKYTASELLAAINLGYIRACHDVADGGIAVALAEMCIAGNIGAKIVLNTEPHLQPVHYLFSESPSMWLVEVKKKFEAPFKRLMQKSKITKLGTVNGEKLDIVINNKKIINVSVDELRERWTAPLWKT